MNYTIDNLTAAQTVRGGFFYGGEVMSCVNRLRPISSSNGLFASGTSQTIKGAGNQPTARLDEKLNLIITAAMKMFIGATFYTIVPKGVVNNFPKTRDTRLVARDMSITTLVHLNTFHDRCCHLVKSIVFAWLLRNKLTAVRNYK